MNTEESLRESLRAHADQPVTGDPWPRVERAHRRSRRRRAVAAGALAALVAGGVALGVTPWAPTADRAQPADQDRTRDQDTEGLRTSWLDDGSPRGELGDGPALEEAVTAVVRRDTEAAGGRLAGKNGVHLLYAGSRNGTILALARAVTVDRREAPAGSSTLDSMYWLVGPDVSALRVLSLYDSASGAPTVVYPDASSDGHALAVVPRGARVAAGRVTVDPDGTAHRAWSAVRNDDGVVDLPVGDVRREGALVIRVTDVETAYSAPLGLTTTTGDGLTPAPMTPGRFQQAVAAESGAGVADRIARRAIEDLLGDLGATADVVEPKVLWAGPVDGVDVVAVAAGIPGQGRMLRVGGYTGDTAQPQWVYRTAVPEGPVGALGWRVYDPVKNQDVVGWFFDVKPDDPTRVQVDGRERATSTSSGLGSTRVEPDQEVTVVHGSTHLILGPEARGAGSSPYAPGR